MASDAFDKRLTPARQDLAAAHFRGRVDAARFVEGEPATVIASVTQVRPRPDVMASLDTQALFGERMTVYERKDGWAWVQLAADDYVGYVREDDLHFAGWRAATHRVIALRAPIFVRADLKSAPQGFLPFNAEAVVTERQGGYVRIGDGQWLADQHVAVRGVWDSDWVASAERCLHAPYLWGGKTPDGLDCSGLIQIAMQASGLACPRDTDMQERALGAALLEGAKLRRGDLVFWKGHVGVMIDEASLLHANAHHMLVALEPVADAIARIAAKGTPVSSIRRLSDVVS
jgi:cell wall-associated NlpC family hydrolase